MHPKIIALVLGLVTIVDLGIATAQAEVVHAAIVVPTGTSDSALMKLLAQRTAADPAALRLNATKVGEGPGFASLTVLEFPSDVAFQEWLAKNPVAAPLTVKRLDLLASHEAATHDRSASIYKVNAYRSKVAAPRYADFASSYIVPLMEGQIEKQVMLDYAMYIERGAVGEALVWLVVEYRDPAAFEAADDIKTKVREDLTAHHAGYAKYDKSKDTLRDNFSETFAKVAATPTTGAQEIPRAASTPTTPKNWAGPKQKILAQALVDELIAGHPEVMSITVHATPPGMSEVYTMIAGSFPDRIGNTSSPGDIITIKKGVSQVEPKWGTPDWQKKVSTVLPLQDAKGTYLPAAMVIAFKTSPQDRRIDTDFLAPGLKIRDGLRSRIANVEALFAPAK